MTAYGFWVFLISDIVMFSCFFAAYAVLVDQTAGGPKGSEIFEQRNVAIETVCLLLSSFTCGMASIAADVRNRFWFYLGMAVTCVLGLIFLVHRVSRIRRSRLPRLWPVAQRVPDRVLLAGWMPRPARLGRRAVAAHHDGPGFAKGFRADILRRMMCFALFWHALDIIWVGVFSVVYLLGGGV